VANHDIAHVTAAGAGRRYRRKQRCAGDGVAERDCGSSREDVAMIVIVPVLLFLAVLGYVAWTRRKDPRGDAGIDQQAHRNIAANGGVPLDPPSGSSFHIGGP